MPVATHALNVAAFLFLNPNDEILVCDDAYKGINKEALNALVMKSIGYVRSSISNVSNLSQNLTIKLLTSKNYKDEKNKNII